MAKTHTVLEVFIASPGDVAPEREVLESVVAEFNLTWGDKHRVRLELVKWETHSRPAIGEDAQDVINRQVGDEYDIFLGIMWGRFGTATARAESGTEEEFQRAYGRLKTGDQVQIMFYFKDAGIPPSRLDGEQIAKVQAFKKKIANEFGALYYQFETTDEFQTKARIHLSKVVQDWLDANTGVIESKTVPEKAEAKPEEYNPLANLAALDDRDADEGVIDLVDRGTEAMDEVVQIVNRMGAATNDLGEKFTQRTKEAEAITDKTDRKSAKRVANNVANDIDIFVKRMSVEIPEFYKQNAIFTESFSKVALIAEKDLDEDADDVETALNNMQEYRTAIDTSSSSLVEFRQTISKLPKMTTIFNQARRRAVAIMDDLLDQLRIASSQAGDIEKLLERLRKPDRDEAQ
ncbi:MAG: DUF4062 domain-containing protein [Planctomycetaceae bacterium]|nr:DUF4062 domain-containing protein [Planctomycetaceae bacterium]